MSMPTPVTTYPTVRSIELTQPLTWLSKAWLDMTRAGWISYAHGLALALAGWAIVAIAHQRFWLLAVAVSGFMVVAPVLATSLYALSRAMEKGEAANLQVVLKTWLNWQNNHINKFSNDYWGMVQFGVLLGVAATGWVLTSAALITLLAPVPINTPEDFIRHVVLARNGWLFEVWLALGGLMAAPIFASSAVSMPLLLDRRITLTQAVLTSWQTVLSNPVPMAAWASLIMLITMLGMGTLMIGLVIAMPLLGHASWHAYRDLVDVTGLAPRDDTAAHGARG